MVGAGGLSLIQQHIISPPFLKATILSVIGRKTILRTENQCSNRIHLPFKKSIGHQLMILQPAIVRAQID